MTVFRIIRISLYSVALLFFAASFVRFAKRNGLPDEPQKYFLPAAYLFIGGISGTLFTGAALASAISSAGWYCELLFSAFSLSGWIMILAQYNCFIEYDDDFIVKRGFFRKVRRFAWDELTETDEDGKILYFRNKKIVADYYLNYEEIVLKARKEYFERHRTKIPVRPEKYKTYNGVVVDPRKMIGPSVFLFGMIALFLGTMLYLTRPISEDELVYKDINVTEYTEEDGTLRVYSDNVDAVMLISGYETSTENTEKMISDIKSGKTMSAGI
ncbi:MAG: hypothetical protein IJR90_08675, partial [Clostridia bacterium]|nr:hypothetical protein [Clostridia bacterium]